jgi:hypothetical protein
MFQQAEGLGSYPPRTGLAARWTLKQVQGDKNGEALSYETPFSLVQFPCAIWPSRVQ